MYGQMWQWSAVVMKRPAYAQRRRSMIYNFEQGIEGNVYNIEISTNMSRWALGPGACAGEEWLILFNQAREGSSYSNNNSASGVSEVM